MNSFLFLAILCCLSILSSGQKKKFEYQVYAGSGAFFFSGDDAVDEVTVGTGRYGMAYGSPLGKKPGLSLFGGFSLQKTIQRNWLYSFGFEYQSLTASADVIRYVSYSPMPGTPGTSLPASGTSKSKFKFLATRLLFGKRFMPGKRLLDITAGPEVAALIDFEQKLDYTIHYSAGPEKRDEKVNHGGSDVNLRMLLQAKLQVNKVGIATGYTRGLTNSYNNSLGRTGYPLKNNFNFFRLGFFYML